MREDRPRLTEPDDARGDECEPRREKHPRNVPPPRALRDEAAQCDEPSCERQVVAPLSRRHPRSRQHRERGDHAEIRRIEDVLAVSAQHELRRYRDRRGERMDPQGVGAQQQRNAEGGDER